MLKGADISECGAYRYSLSRRWGLGRSVTFIGLNPSTADAEIDDPTVKRWMGFAKAWGYDAMLVANLFAFRATSPKDMQKADEPIGPDNNVWIQACAEAGSQTVVCWGKPGSFQYRDVAVTALLKEAGHDLWCFGTNADDSPKHPLYLPKGMRLVRYA